MEESGSAEALDGLGRALWWLKRVSEGIEARPRAYTAFRKAKRSEEAALVAAWLAREHRSLYRNDVAADGWLARAQSSAERLADTAAHGWILIAKAEASSEAAAAIDLGRKARFI